MAEANHAGDCCLCGKERDELFGAAKAFTDWLDREPCESLEPRHLLERAAILTRAAIALVEGKS